MDNYWTNFAKVGNPNGKEKGEWTPYTDKIPNLMILDVKDKKASCTMSNTPVYKGSSFKWR